MTDFAGSKQFIFSFFLSSLASFTFWWLQKVTEVAWIQWWIEWIYCKIKSVLELKVTKFQSLFSFIRLNINWSSSMNNLRYIDNFKGLQPRSAKCTKNGRIVGMFDFIETEIWFLVWKLSAFCKLRLFYSLKHVSV